MLANGGTNYKLPHIGKAKLCNNGTLPVSLTCRPKAIYIARQNIDEQTLSNRILLILNKMLYLINIKIYFNNDNKGFLITNRMSIIFIFCKIL